MSNKTVTSSAIILAIALVLGILYYGFLRNDDRAVAPVITASSTDGTVFGNNSLSTTSGNGTISSIVPPLNSTTSQFTLLGKYTTYEVTMYPIDYDEKRDPKPATTTCSAFTVTGGDAYPISVYKEMIMNRNTVNHLDGAGNLVLNIDLNDLSPDQKNVLINSNSVVSLQIKMRELAGKDAKYCASFVDLISVKK